MCFRRFGANNYILVQKIFCPKYLFHQILKTFKSKCVSGDSKQVTLFIFIYLSQQLPICLPISLCLELATYLVG